MHYLSEQNILLFLLQLLILLGFARGLGEVFRYWHQPPMTAEILVGIILGPTIFGRLSPELQQSIFPLDQTQNYMLETVSWLGVFFLLLQAGLEIDFSTAWRQRGDALKLALVGTIIPMTIVFGVVMFIPDHYLVDPSRRIIFSLFMATVMSITALTIVARTLQDLNLNKTDMGLLVLTSLSISDILGWMIFTIILVLFMSGNIVVGQLFQVLSLTLIFVGLSLSVGRRHTDWVITKIKNLQMPEPSTSLTFICLLGFLCGAITQKIGIHALLGFLLAGVMASEVKALSERTRQIIAQMVFAIFVPLFFASIGLRLDFLENFDWFLVLLFVGLSIAGKFFGAWIATLTTSVSKDLRVPVAIAHIPGGVMEIVVGMVAVEQNLITEKIFVAIVCSAIGSSVLVGPWLNYSIKRRKYISVMEFFTRRGVIAEFKGANKESIITQLCEMACLQQNMPPVDFVIESVLTREKDMGTALDKGVAVPHARLAGLRRSVVVFGRLESGLDWDSPDGKLTHFIFLILTPEKDDGTQIQILRSIAHVASDEKTRERLLKAPDSETLWDILGQTFTEQNIKQKSS